MDADEVLRKLKEMTRYHWIKIPWGKGRFDYQADTPEWRLHVFWCEIDRDWCCCLRAEKFVRHVYGHNPIDAVRAMELGEPQ